MYQEGEVSLAALKPLKPRVLDIDINSQASERVETLEEDISELRNGLRDWRRETWQALSTDEFFVV